MAILILVAGGGASSQPAGLALGVPSLGFLALSILAGALVWASGVNGLAGLLLPVVGLLIGSFLLPTSTSILLFSGPPLFALALAGVVLAVQSLGARPPRSLLVPAFLAIYAMAAFQAQTRVGPDGDEPQYLMVADSLLRDHDLALEPDFKEARYSTFFSRALEPHFRIRGPEGQIYSLHAVGLPVLIFPAYALGGYGGASFFLALLAALLVREIRRLIEALTGNREVAEGTAWIVGLSPPLIHFAGLIFTEIPAALFLCIGLRTAIFGRTPRTLVAAALCAAALPWLNVRYVILAMAIVGALVWQVWKGRATANPRRFLAPAAILAGSAFAIGLYHYLLWGFWDPRRVYGRRREFGLEVLPEGLPGLFFDQEFGLFVYAPIFVLSWPGLLFLWKRHRPLALAAGFALAGVIGTASVWPMWRGGFNPPARFLVPLVSILACGLALSLLRGVRPAAALLAGWSLWCGLGGAMNIETIHRDREGVAPFFRTQSGAREWTAVLPSFVLSEDRATRVLVWPWALLLAIPFVGALRQPRSDASARALRARDLAMASMALVTTAMVADGLSPRVRSPEHDAVRLLGAPSLLLPSLGAVPALAAGWPLDLIYEPHRHPLGQPIVTGLTIPSGRYEVILSTDDTPAHSPPALVVTRLTTGVRSLLSTKQEEASLTAHLTLDTGGRFDLALRYGEPRTLRFFELRPIER